MPKRLMIKVGEYPDKQDSTKMKGEYVRVGVIINGENGEFALLDPSVNLAGCLIKQRILNAGKQTKSKGDMVMCSIFTDQPQGQQQSGGGQQQGQQHGQQQGQPAQAQFEDDIPF